MLTSFFPSPSLAATTVMSQMVVDEKLLSRFSFLEYFFLSLFCSWQNFSAMYWRKFFFGRALYRIRFLAPIKPRAETWKSDLTKTVPISVLVKAMKKMNTTNMRNFLAANRPLSQKAFFIVILYLVCDTKYHKIQKEVAHSIF